jgi:hypothetical protein
VFPSDFQRFFFQTSPHVAALSGAEPPGRDVTFRAHRVRQTRWRAVTAPHQVALARAGFEKGLEERWFELTERVGCR